MWIYLSFRVNNDYAVHFCRPTLNSKGVGYICFTRLLFLSRLIWTELFVNNAQVRKDDELSEKIDSSLIDNDALKEAGMAKADRAVKGVSINVTNENDLY